MKQVGVVAAQVIKVLGLDIEPGTPIYLGDTNIAHMVAEHGQEYRLYGRYIEDIILHPTYVG